jgi:hypothetical protein
VTILPQIGISDPQYIYSETDKKHGTTSLGGIILLGPYRTLFGRYILRRSLAFAWTLALAIFVASEAHAEGIKLAYKFRAGEIENYKLSMRISIDMAGFSQMQSPLPMTMNIAMAMRQKTLGVYPDGSAKVYITCNEMKVNVPGKMALPKQQFKSPPITMVMAPDGSVRKIEGLEKTLAFSGAKGADLSALQIKELMNFIGQAAVFPPSPLEIGQSWENSIPLPFGESHIKILSTLASANCAVGKTNAVKIEQTFDGSLDFSEILKSITDMIPANDQGRDVISGMTGGMEMFGTMVHYFAPSIGKIVKGRGELVANLLISMPPQLVKMGGPPRIDMTMNMVYDLTRL